MLTIAGNVAYATSIVCSNAFLPGLAREDEEVLAAADGRRGSLEEEVVRLLDPATRASLDQDLGPPSPHQESTSTHHAKVLSLSTSRLSSTGTALGFLSGLLMLIALVIPVTILQGSTASLQLAIGLTGAWWAIFTIPAWIGLPAGEREQQAEKGGKHWLIQAWSTVGRMMRWSEMKSLPNLYTFLLAWIFLSDGSTSYFFIM